MKNKFLLFTIAAVGALLITATNGFAKSSYGNEVDTACAPVSPFAGNCNLCHVPGGSRSDYTDAMYAYKDGGTIMTDFFCPDPTPTCTDNDGDGYGDPGDSSCSDGSTKDCDDKDPSTYPDALEVCDDQIDNDCDGKFDCSDSNCDTDSYCLAASCERIENRGPCKTDPRCDWSGKGKRCYTVSKEKADCTIGGGRWSKKNNDCIYR